MTEKTEYFKALAKMKVDRSSAITDRMKTGPLVIT